MKTLRLFIALALISLIGTINSNAQGRFGADSANCVSYLNFYKEYYKLNKLKDASQLWQKAFKTCPPTASQNLLVDGNKILKYLMKEYKPGTPEYNSYVDSIMMLHDLRAEYYPKYALRANENKAFDYISLIKNDDKKVRDVIIEVLDMGKNNANVSLIVALMLKDVDLYKNNEITADDVLSDYAKYSEVIQVQLSQEPSDDNKAAQIAFENEFINSGVATCENLIKVFEPRFNDSITDVNLVKTIAKVLADRECISEPLYLRAVEKMHELEPSFSSAYYLYKLYAFKKEERNAMNALNEALNYEDITKDKKAELLLELAAYTFKNNLGVGKAIGYAKEAMELDPALSGKANFLIGTIWSNQRCGGNEIESRAKYWVATDYIAKAKAQDSTLTEEADKLLRQFRQYFPNAADAFMYDVVDGASYTVSCGGISATTTVRTNK